MSTRQKAELADEAAHPERVVAPHRPTLAMTANTSFCDRVRDRQTREADRKAEVKPTAAMSTADFYYDQYKLEQAQKAAEEQEKIRKKRQQLLDEQAEVNRRNAAREERRKMLPVMLMFSNIAATPQEIERVTRLVAQKYPDQSRKYSYEAHWGILMEIRALTQPAPNQTWQL